MPVADHARYGQMLDRAQRGRFAYPAVNVTSLTTANAVLRGLAESRSDGIIQVSMGGAAFASGSAVKDMVLGAVSIAEHVHRVAERYPVWVALRTDHCAADKLEKFVIPLVEETERGRAAGRPNLFNGHMFDGSALPYDPRAYLGPAEAAMAERVKQALAELRATGTTMADHP
jgi:fructose-bisphosphate aldolase, class II